VDGLRSDSRGFISEVCPACSRGFKIPLIRGGIPRLAHCPYCEYRGDNFLTPEQRKYMQALTARLAINALKTGVTPPSLPPTPVEANDDLPSIASFPCCEGRIRHDGASSSLYCPFCGKADAAQAP